MIATTIIYYLLFYITCSSSFRQQNFLKRPAFNVLSMNADNGKKTVVIVGATGYIGKYVTRESVRRGFETIAVVRSSSSSSSSSSYLDGAKIVYGDVTDQTNLQTNVFKDRKVDVVISCLASRSGVKDDSYLIDYQATLNALNCAIDSKADQFILLSAFCVRKPLLQFQNAKLKFEQALIDAQKRGAINKYSIVRPTAFFKSVSGQLETLQKVFYIHKL